MRTQFKYFCTALLFIFLFACKANASKTVSVFVEGDLTELQEQIVSNAFMSRLSSSKDYTVFERNKSFLKSVTREHDYQTSGDVPESQIRKIASKYGVDFVIAITVMKDEENFFMSARLINIENGQVVKTVTQDRNSITNQTLKNLSNNIAYRLINSTSK